MRIAGYNRSFDREKQEMVKKNPTQKQLDGALNHLKGEDGYINEGEQMKRLISGKVSRSRGNKLHKLGLLYKNIRKNGKWYHKVHKNQVSK